MRLRCATMTIGGWVHPGLLILAFSSAANAQPAPPAIPPSIEPDIRLEQAPSLKAPAIGSELLVPEAARSRAPAGSEEVRFVLGAVHIKGVTAYPTDALTSLYTSSMGQEVSLADVYEIAAAIQRRYRDDGYFLARVIIPAQRIADGEVTLEVVEGYVADFSFEGEIGPVEARIRQYLQGVVGERPLRLATLERYLLLSRDIPGVTVNSTLSPASDVAGAAVLVVSVSRKSYEAMAVVDNIGSKFTGKWELIGSVARNSFTRYGERLAITGLAAFKPSETSSNENNQGVVQGIGSFLFGSEGQYAVLTGSYGNSNPGNEFAQFDFETKQLLLSAVTGYPIIRSRTHNVTAEFGLDYINSNTDVFDDQKLIRDKIRVLRLGGIWSFDDKWRGSSMGTLGIRQGLPILNSTTSDDSDSSRPGGTARFTSLQASLSRLQALGDPFALYLAAAGQYSFNKLLSPELFGVGGIRFGRGYNPKELAGDQGIGFTTELQYTRPATLKHVDSYQLFGFYDFGKVWFRGGGDSRSLASAGGGVRAWLARDFSLEVQIAKPLTRASQRADDTYDAQLLFRAIGRF